MSRVDHGLVKPVDQENLTGVSGVVHVVEMDVGVEVVDSAVGRVSSGPGGDGGGEGQDGDEDLHSVFEMFPLRSTTDDWFAPFARGAVRNRVTGNS